MTKNEILKKIGIILIELREQYDMIQLNRDDINDIDLELFIANSHFLTDHAEILRKLHSREAKPVKELPPEPKYFEPVVKPSVPEKKQPVFDLTEEAKETIVPQEQQEAEPADEVSVPEPLIRHELLLDETGNDDDTWASEEEMEKEITEDLLEPYVEQTWEEEEDEAPAYLPVAETTATEPEILIPEPEPVPEWYSAPAETPAEEPVAETYAEPVIITPQPEPEVIRTQVVINDPEDRPLVTINQILSAQTSPQRFGHELKPITDLKSAITLNDKLLFVRDLFNGYSMAYGEAIEILNRFSRFEEADNFLKINYYVKNNWEAKQATTDKFYEILQRRFPE